MMLGGTELCYKFNPLFFYLTYPHNLISHLTLFCLKEINVKNILQVFTTQILVTTFFIYCLFNNDDKRFLDSQLDV